MASEELTPFGQLMRDGMKRAGLSQGRLGGLISDFRNGPVFDASGIRLIMQGRRRLDRELVGKIITTLDLDPIPAWHAAGLWPEGLEPEDVADLSERLTTRRLAARAGSHRGGQDAADPLISDQQGSTTVTSFASPEKAAA